MLLFMLLALLLGCASVTSNMINFRATKALGTWNGTLVNYVVASILAFILLNITNHFHVDWNAFVKAPPYLYLGGVFGVIALVILMVSLNKMKVFQCTTLILVGQLTVGILFDIIVYKNFTLLKAVGILLVASGIILDKKLTVKE